MRLIDADALVRELEVGYCDEECDRNLDCVRGRDCPIYDEVTHIYEAETVDAVPIEPLARALDTYAMAPDFFKGRPATRTTDDVIERNRQAWESWLRSGDWKEAT